MRTIKTNTRRRPLWHTVLLAIVAIAFGGAGTVAALAGLKVIDPAKLAFWKSKEAIPKNWIPIPFCVRTIPAYTRVTRDYLMIDLKTDTWALKWYSPEKVPRGAITKLVDILGRVTAREKPAAYAFSEGDFLPEGTSPGVAGGTPEGKRAITLDAGKLNGVHDLKEGDHVDLLASVSVDMPGASRSSSGRLGTSVVATPSMDLLLPKRGYVTSLVQDGVVVTPVRIRNAPVSSSSLTQGTTNRTRPVQEIVLAVEPKEVAPLAEAMDLKYEITCVARSGRPRPVQPPAAHSSDGRAAQNSAFQIVAALKNAILGKDGATGSGKAVSAPSGKETAGPKKIETPAKNNEVAMDITPGLNPMDQIRFMEVMVGPQHQFVLFNGPGNSPVVASQDDGSAKAGSGAGAAETSKQ